MRADQDTDKRFRPWETARFRLWACVPAAVLSIGLFLLALAAALSDPAILRPVVRLLAWLAAIAWAAAAGLGWDDRRRIAAATRPNRLAHQYVRVSLAIAVLATAAGLWLTVPGWPSPDLVATGCLGLAAVGAVVTWQAGLSIRVDLDAAAHIRAARPLALPAPRHSADDADRRDSDRAERPGTDRTERPGPERAGRRGADHAQPAADELDDLLTDLPANAAASAAILRRPRRHR